MTDEITTYGWSNAKITRNEKGEILTDGYGEESCQCAGCDEKGCATFEECLKECACCIHAEQ